MKRRFRTSSSVASVLGILTYATGAKAHTSLEGAGAFPNGLLHPVVEPAHVIVLTAIGLLITQQAEFRLPRLFLCFVAPFALGLAAVVTYPEISTTAIGKSTLWIAAASTGILVAWTAPFLKPVTAPVIVVAALTIGIDTATTSNAIIERIIFAAGAWLGGALLVVNLALGVRRLHHWPCIEIGTRIAGSWIAAAAFMMIALTFSQPT